MMISRAALCLGLVLSLGACDALQNKNRLPFDGQYYRAKASKIDGDRQNFSIAVRPVSASFEGAQQAGAHEATKYCIENYGSSAVIWTIGPDADPSTYQISGDTLVLQGTCEG